MSKRSPHAVSSYRTEAGLKSAQNAAPGSLERFIVQCALTFGCPPIFYRSPLKSRQRVAESPQSSSNHVWSSAVFRYLGDYVTHPDVLGLDFSMRNAIRRCSVAMHVSNLISAPVLGSVRCLHAAHI